MITANAIAEINKLEPISTFEHFTSVASEAKSGDVINQLVVDRAASRFGPKWTELRTADGALIWRVESATEIRVGRWIETEESKIARNRATQNIFIADRIARWVPAGPVILAKMAAGTVASYSDIQNLMAAQAEDELMASFIHVVKHQAEVHPERDVTEVLDMFIADLTGRLVSKAEYAANRSTSAVSNIMDDLKLQAMAAFINRKHLYI